MEVHKPLKTDFMGSFKRYEPVIVDSTAMMHFKTCPLKYFYRIVLGFEPKTAAPYFAFGSAYHKFREVLERVVAAGGTEQEAFISALTEAEAYAVKHLEVQAPGSQWDFLTLARLKQSCAEAFKWWINERRSGAIKVISFEQPFTLQLPDGTWIAGRADQIVNWKGKVWGRDFKTTSKLGPYYSRNHEPNDQFTRYTWAEGKLSGTQVEGQIIEALYNSKKEGPALHVYTTTRTPGQLDRWVREHEYWTNQIAECRELDLYPMNEKHCSFCEFHNVCKAPSISGQMSTLKNFYRIKPWDCTTVRD